jgi:hypothetical protein
MARYSFKLTEEIARWAFEILLNQSRDWYIAFTNPTAGPWKRVMALDDSGLEGEVHRFAREEERPDLLLVSDKYRLIIILEAKDSLTKLITDSQIEKSANVVLSLAKLLKGKESNKFWGKRAHYTVVAGLLWGAEQRTTEKERQEAFKAYLSILTNEENLCSPILIGVESYRDKEGGITCTGYVSHHGEIYQGFTGKSLLEALSVQM